MNDQEAIVELATKVFNWVQDGDPNGFKFKMDAGTIGTFIPDHEPGDAGIVIDKMNRLGYTTFHFEPVANQKWKAYFTKPEWEMIAGPDWKNALVRAALRAVMERTKELAKKSQSEAR